MPPRNNKLLRKCFVDFLFPTFYAAIALQMSMIVGNIIIGHLLGADALAVVGLVLPLIQGLVAVYAFFGIGGTILAALAKGEGKEREASEIFTLSVIGMFFSGTACAVGGFLFHHQLVSLLTSADPSLAKPLADFLYPFYLCIPLFVTVLGIAYFIRTDGMPKFTLGMILLVNLLVMVLIPFYILILGNISAFSWALVTGYSSAVPVLCGYFLSRNRTFRFVVPTRIWHNCAALLGSGVPIAIGNLQIPLKIFCVNITISAFSGAAGLAVYFVIISCVMVISLFIAGVVQTMMPMTGILFGQKDWRGIRFVFRDAFVTVMSCATVLCILLEMFPETVLAIFGLHEPIHRELGVSAIRIFAPSILGIAVVALLRSHVQAIGRPFLATMLVVTENIIAMLPPLWILSYLFGVSGIWLAFIASEVLTIVLYYLFVKFQDDRRFLLLPRNDHAELIFETTIAAETTAVDDFITYCESQSIMSETDLVAIRRVLGNVVENVTQHRCIPWIDIRLQHHSENIVLTICDAGPPYDPRESHNDFEYSRSLIFNSVTSTLQQPS